MARLIQIYSEHSCGGGRQGKLRMYVHRAGSDVFVRAPAKLNLFLEVLRKRGDGFHDIETLMVPIGLYDNLNFQPQPDGPIQVSCCWARSADTADCGPLPAESDNLVTKALVKLRDCAGVAQGAKVELVKSIPSAAGLGGGSSDAAAALVAANLGWNLGLSLAELAQIASELGSDVPFFLFRSAAICRGRGEQIEPVTGLGRLHFVVVRPPVGLSTADVYRRCRPAVSPGRVEPLVAALRRGEMRGLGERLANRLEPPAMEMSPWIGRLKKEFAEADCPAHQMSGSGSSYFGICRHARHARAIAGRLRSRGLGRVLAVSS